MGCVPAKLTSSVVPAPQGADGTQVQPEEKAELPDKLYAWDGSRNSNGDTIAAGYTLDDVRPPSDAAESLGLRHMPSADMNAGASASTGPPIASGAKRKQDPVVGAVQAPTVKTPGEKRVRTQGGAHRPRVRRGAAKVAEQIPPLLDALRKIGEAELVGTSAIDQLIELVEEGASSLKPHIQQLANLALDAASNTRLSEDSRVMSGELLMALCENETKAMRKLGSSFLQRLHTTIMGYLLDIEDTPAWHGSDGEETQWDGEGPLGDFGQELLDRLALAMPSKALVTQVRQLVTLWVQSTDWKRRYAALLSLAQMAEGCKEVFLESSGMLGFLAGAALQGLQDPHPRVRWAACQALGQMSSDLAPTFQLTQHGRVVPGLLAAMDDFRSPRVQAHAAAALVNFSEEDKCRRACLRPYLEPAVAKLLDLLQRGSLPVQEGVLTTLASICGTSQDDIVPFYDQIMPPAVAALQRAHRQGNRTLRSRALECASMLGLAVGADMFLPDAVVLIQVIGEIQTSGVADHDSTGYVMQACSRISEALGPALGPHASVILPPVLEAVEKCAAAAKVRPPDSPGGPHGFQSALLAAMMASDDDETISGEGGGASEVNSLLMSLRAAAEEAASLDEYSTAVNMMCTFATKLEAAFWPYCIRTAGAILPLLSIRYSDELQLSAAKCVAPLIKSAVLAAQLPEGAADEEVVKQLVTTLWAALLKVAQSYEELEEQLPQLEVLQWVPMAATASKFMAPELVQETIALFKNVVATAMERRTARRELGTDGRRRRGGDNDDDEEDDQDDDDDGSDSGSDDVKQDEAVLDAVGTGLGYLLVGLGDEALALVQPLLDSVYMGLFLGASSSPVERCIAICLMDDVLEYCPAGCQQHFGTVLPVLLEYCTSNNAPLRQSACYGVKVAAVKGGAAFDSFREVAVVALLSALRKSRSGHEQDAEAFDNAVSALGRILELHPRDLDADREAMRAWMAGLPLKSDLSEAKQMHALLASFLQSQDPRLQEYASLPQAVAVLVTAVAGPPGNLLEKDAVAGVVTLLKGLKAEAANLFEGPEAELTPAELLRYRALMADS